MKILREKGGILATEEGTSALSLLYRITQFAHVFPRCYELNGINEDDLELVESGPWDETFRVYHNDQEICLKATLVSPEDNGTRLRVKPLVLIEIFKDQILITRYSGSGEGVCDVGPSLSRKYSPSLWHLFSWKVAAFVFSLSLEAPKYCGVPHGIS